MTRMLRRAASTAGILLAAISPSAQYSLSDDSTQMLAHMQYDRHDVRIQGIRTGTSSSGGAAVASSPRNPAPAAAPGGPARPLPFCVYSIPGRSPAGSPDTSHLPECNEISRIGGGIIINRVRVNIPLHTGGTVPAPAAPDPAAIVITQHDLQSLPIHAGTISLQPDSGRTLIHLPVIAYSDATTHDLTTTILDTPVTVRVTPLTYTWDFGAGIPPFTTTDPGRPYPNHTVSATYRHVAENLTVNATITWAGEYHLNNTGPWLPIDGTATTTITSQPFNTHEAPARLTG